MVFKFKTTQTEPRNFDYDYRAKCKCWQPWQYKSKNVVDRLWDMENSAKLPSNFSLGNEEILSNVAKTKK